MKKLVLTLLLLLGMTVASAQDVYNELHRKAQEVVNDPKSDNLVKQFSQFKLDALDYMAIKMREQMPDSTVMFLDRQALALSDFITLYMQTLLNNRTQPKAYQVKLIELFMDASYSNPLFYDSDKELVLSYFADGNSLTRFSIDTDWRRALLAVRSQLIKNK